MAASEKTVGVLQSNYVPWKGYFDIIHDVDEFIFYDDVQYTTRDWRNRNLIKTAKGAAWLTVPVGADLRRLICEVVIEDSSWQAKHWQTIQQNYSRAPHFERYKSFFEAFYCGTKWDNLSVMNQQLLKGISQDLLGIQVAFRDSREFQPTGDRLGRLLDLLQKTQARTFVVGPAAKTYFDLRRFEDAGIRLTWKDYSGYPEYPQFFGPFVHQVSILDLLFQVGPAAPEYIWGWRQQSARAGR